MNIRQQKKFLIFRVCTNLVTLEFCMSIEKLLNNDFCLNNFFWKLVLNF